jgi:glycosyltransferase involved in cell wall biosynthesis
MLPLHTFRRAVVRFVLPASRILAEGIALGPLPFLRKFSRRMLHREIALVEPHIDRDFYLRQVVWPPSRMRAARDPALHYVLIGRYRSFSPHPDFDPVFYHDDNPDLGWSADPLSHYAQRAPGAAVRTADWAKMDVRKTGGNAGTIATLSHGRGGGSTHYLGLYENALRSGGFRVIRFARCSARDTLFRAVDLVKSQSYGPVLHLIDDEDAFASFIKQSGVSRLVVNHLIDLPQKALDAIPRICRSAGIPFEMILHDYYLLCQRINLVDHTDRYCGIADVERCRVCLRKGAMSVPGAIDPAEWRSATLRFLQQADRVLVPSEDTRRHLAEQWPELALTVWQPEDDATIEPALARAPAPGETLRIVILGKLNAPKGFHVVHRLARAIRAGGLPLQLIVIGSTLDDFALRRAGVTVTGRYREADLDALIREHDPHAGFIPAIWPETWSFTLTALLRHRLHVTAFDIGAVADRLRTAGSGTILPCALEEDPSAQARHFLSLPARMRHATPPVRSAVA